MPNITIVLLAAGASSRMGSPKPLLRWKNKTLIEERIQTLQQCQPSLLVVLGAYADQIVPLIDRAKVATLINPFWKNGMSTTIAFAIQNILKKDTLPDGILLTTIDQAFVDSAYLNAMIDTFQVGKEQIMVSQSENNWKGIPVLFDRVYFEELSQISGDNGAKEVVKKYPNKVTLCYGGSKLVDMDTPEIYQQHRRLAPDTDH